MAILLALAVLLLSRPEAAAQFQSYARQTQAGGMTKSAGQPFKYGGGIVYPEFRHPQGIVRWPSERMPLKVFVSPGWCLDEFIDESLGAPIMNIDNTKAWPVLLLDLLQTPQRLQELPVAQGYTQEAYHAACQGILLWKPFEQERLFSYALTTDPTEADIFLFWTHHFVNKMGLALLANDHRGLTSKDIFSVKAILAGGKAVHKPVVIVLATTESNGTQIPLPRLKAAAAHEFGHALGIDGHSSNPVDLMSKFYGRGVISPNDAATIRYMYRQPPDMIP